MPKPILELDLRKEMTDDTKAQCLHVSKVWVLDAQDGGLNLETRAGQLAWQAGAKWMYDNMRLKAALLGIELE